MKSRRCNTIFASYVGLPDTWQRRTLFGLINYNLKAINLIKSELCVIRPWSLLLNQKRIINKILIVPMVTEQYHHVPQYLNFVSDQGKFSQVKTAKSKF